MSTESEPSAGAGAGAGASSQGGKVEESKATGHKTWEGDWKGINPGQPGIAARSLARFQTVKAVETADPKSKKPQGHVRIVCISDTHSLHSRGNMVKIPDGDILVHAGDFSNVGKAKEVKEFAEWIGSLPHKHKIVIAGNHDVIMDEKFWRKRGFRRFHAGKLEGSTEECRGWLTSNCTYLEDSGVEVEGLKFWGSPWQPEFCDWAFNLDRGQDLQEKWDLIPSDIDVLITHGPPSLHGDECSDGFRAGCVNLLYEIQERIKPKLHVFGHIHEGYGATTDGTTTYVNASTCTFRYRPSHPPIVVDVPVRAPTDAAAPTPAPAAAPAVAPSTGVVAKSAV